MRLIVETLYDFKYIEVILTQEELERVKKKGVCMEFTDTELQDKYLNIFVRTEELEEFYAAEEGEKQESD
jgi:hypothetical protein